MAEEVCELTPSAQDLGKRLGHLFGLACRESTVKGEERSDLASRIAAIETIAAQDEVSTRQIASADVADSAVTFEEAVGRELPGENADEERDFFGA